MRLHVVLVITLFTTAVAAKEAAKSTSKDPNFEVLVKRSPSLEPPQVKMLFTDPARRWIVNLTDYSNRQTLIFIKENIRHDFTTEDASEFMVDAWLLELTGYRDPLIVTQWVAGHSHKIYIFNPRRAGRMAARPILTRTFDHVEDVAKSEDGTHVRIRHFTGEWKSDVAEAHRNYLEQIFLWRPR